MIIVGMWYETNRYGESVHLKIAKMQLTNIKNNLITELLLLPCPIN